MSELPQGFVLDQAPAAPPVAPPSDLPTGFTLDHPSLWEDVPKSAGIGLVKGTIGLVGTPADAGDAAAHATEWAASKLTGEPPKYTSGRQNLEDLAKRVPVIGNALARYVDMKLPPNSATITKGVEAISGKLGLGDKLYQSQTTPGHYAETAASFIPQTLMDPEASVGSVMKYAIAPGIASEAAGEATKGTKIEPFARIAAALGTSGIAALLSKPGTAGQLMRDAGVDHLSPEDMGKVADLMETGNVTLPEAIQHVTNGATNVADLQRVVEQSRTGGPIMKDFLAQRAGKNADMVGQSLDQIAPQTGIPFEIAPKVQEAATGAVQDAEGARSAATSPHYKAAATDTVAPEKIEGILQRLDAAIGDDKTGILSKPLSDVRDLLTAKPAIPEVAGTPGRYVNGQYQPAVAGTPATARTPVTDIENLDRARKYIRDKLSLPAFAAEATPKEAASHVSGILSDIRNEMEDASAEFAAGRATHEQITQNEVNPLIRSPTGQLAAAETFPQQAKVIFDPNPLPGSEKAIGEAVSAVAKTDPDAARALVRTHLEQTFNEATQRLQGGENQWGGAKFAAIIKGNPQQAKNLEAAIRALPDGDATWAGFRRTLDVMEAQGRRLPANSATTFNQQIMDALGKPGDPISNVATLAASPSKALSFVRNAYEDFRRGRNTEILAKLFTDPNAVQGMKDLTRYSPQSTTARRIVAGLVGKAYVDSATAGRGLIAPPNGPKAPGEPDATAQNDAANP